MFLILSKILWGLAAPGNAMALLLLLGTVLSFTRLWRWGRAVCAVVAIAALLIAVTPISDWVARPLENRFPRPNQPEHVDGIIMLGGAVNPHLAHDRNEPSVNDAAERLFTFVELAHRYPTAKLVFSGGSGSLLDKDIKEDTVVRAVLAQIGFADDRVIYENQSRNTWENAVFSQAIVNPKAGERWLLVTSALHMPRAVGIFRNVGWTVIPYPVDYRTLAHADFRGFDLEHRLRTLSDALREWIGLVAYRVTGRTMALLPSPATPSRP